MAIGHWRKYDSVKGGALRDFSAKGGGVSSIFSQILLFLVKNQPIFNDFYLFLVPKGGGRTPIRPPPIYASAGCRFPSDNNVPYFSICILRNFPDFASEESGIFRIPKVEHSNFA